MHRTTAYVGLFLARFERNVKLYMACAALIGFSAFGIYSVLFNLYLLRMDAKTARATNTILQTGNEERRQATNDTNRSMSLRGGPLYKRLGVPICDIATVTTAVGLRAALSTIDFQAGRIHYQVYRFMRALGWQHHLTEDEPPDTLLITGSLGRKERVSCWKPRTNLTGEPDSFQDPSDPFMQQHPITCKNKPIVSH